MNNPYGSKGIIEKSVDLTKDGKIKRWDQIINQNVEDRWEDISKNEFDEILRRVCKPDKANTKKQ